jgi:predicted nucleic acid-binding OB-fold protein
MGKPICLCLVENQDPTIAEVLDAACDALKKVGQKEKVKELRNRVLKQFKSFEQSMEIIREYVEIVGKSNDL